MEEFYLSSKAIYRILQNKGVECLYHANTVSTAVTFINNRSLLSRAYVEKNGLFQTPQKSDEEDKVYNVWDDVFLDGLDLHDKYRRPNKYGPVLFVFKLDLLLSPSFPHILITRNNPWYWKKGEPWDHRYYLQEDQVENDYLNGKGLDSRTMFTLRSPGLLLKLNKYLKFIGIDKPNILMGLRIGGQKNVGEYAYDKITTALRVNRLGHIPVKFRHSSNSFFTCPCNAHYTLLYNTNYNEFSSRYRVIEP